jgi:uncharacterized protein (DUF2062 family)
MTGRQALRQRLATSRPRRRSRGHGRWHDRAMRDWIRQRMPTEAALRAHKGLRWLAPLLGRPWLWHLNRRRVALGVGIGVFCGLITPLAQIAGAALLAVLLRANLPVAAVATFVTNPVTFAPIFVLAYRTGASLLGESPRPGAAEAVARAAQAPAEAGDPRPDWIERARAVGKPLFLGLAVFAVVGGVTAWGLVHVGWTLANLVKRRRRRRRARR